MQRPLHAAILLLALILAVASATPARAASHQPAERVFTDVPFSHPDADAIYYLARNKLIQGYPDGRFGPTDPLTRAAATTIAVKLAGFAARPAGSPLGFRDLPADHWAVPAIRAAVENKLVVGFDDQTFRPGDSLTRAQLATLALRASRQPVDRVPDIAIGDVQPGDWFYQAAVLAVVSGMAELSDGMFRPNAVATRAEAARAFAQALMYSAQSLDVPLQPMLEPERGLVELAAPGSDAFRAITVPTPMPEGARVRTGAASAANISLPDGSAIYVDALSELLLVRSRGAALVGGTGVEDLQVDLIQGKIFGAVTPRIAPEDLQAYSRYLSSSPESAEADRRAAEAMLPRIRAASAHSGANLPARATRLMLFANPASMEPGDREGVELTIVLVDDAGEPVTAELGPVTVELLSDAGSFSNASPAIPQGFQAVTVQVYPPAEQPADAKTRVTAVAGEVSTSIAIPTDKSSWWQGLFTKKVRATVRMPWSVASVRGTFLSAEATASGNTLSVLGGDAALRSVTGDQELVADNQAASVFSPDEPPSQPAPLTNTEQQQWNAQKQWVATQGQKIAENAPPQVRAEVQSENTRIANLVTALPADKIAPTIQLSAPAVGTLLGTPTVIVEGIATDNVKLSGVTVNGSAASVDAGGSFRATVTLQPGLNRLSAVATDASGNTSSADVTVQFNAQAPSISVTAPEVTRERSVRITGTATAPGGLRSVTLNETSVQPGADGSFVATARLAPGLNLITATVTDSQGRTAAREFRVTSAPEPPVISLEQGPATVGKPQFTLNGKAAAQYTRLQSLTVNGASVLVAADGAFTHPLQLKLGANTVEVVARDIAGNVTTLSRSITVDAGAPTLSLTFPRDGLITRAQSIEVRGTATAPAGLRSLTVNGQAVTPAANGSFSARVDLQEGANAIAVELTGELGRTASVARSVYLLTTPPTLVVTNPEDGQLAARQDLVVTGISAAAFGPLAGVTVNGQSMLMGVDNSYSNTVMLQTGENTITVESTDSAGNQTRVTRKVSYRPTAAILVVREPLEGFYTDKDSLTVRGKVDNFAGVQSVSVNGVDAPLSSDGTFSVTVKLSPGKNLITVALPRTAGGGTDSRTVIYSHRPPSLAVTTPADKSTTAKAEVTVSGVAVTSYGTPAYVYVNDLVTGTDDNGRFSMVVPLKPGDTIITVRAEDDVPTRTTITRTISFKPALPLIHITEPLDGARTQESSIPVRGRVTTAVGIATVDAGGVAATVDSAGNFSATVPLKPGANQITVTARDTAGGTTSATVTANRTGTPPLLSVSAPADDAQVGTPTVLVTGTATALAGQIKSVTVNGLGAAVAPDGSWVTQVPLVAGANTLTVVATDTIGNTSTLKRTVRFAQGVPSVTLSSPADGATVSTSTVLVSGRAQAAAGIKSVTVNGSSVNVGSDGSFQTSVPLQSGRNSITVAVTDALDRNTSATRTVLLVNRPPSLSVTFPSDGATISQATISVTGSATAAEGVKIASVTVNGSDAALDAGGGFSATMRLSPGPNTITVRATDSAGNSTTVTRRVTLSAGTLSVSIGSLPSGASDQISVTGSVTGATGSVQVSVNGVAAALDASGGWSARVSLSPGANTVRAIATDSTGRTATAEGTATFTPAPPSLSVSQPQSPTTSPSATVSGSASSQYGNLVVSVAGQTFQLGQGGSFSAEVQLAQGDNTISVNATDRYGSTSESVNVNYTPSGGAPLPPPTGNTGGNTGGGTGGSTGGNTGGTTVSPAAISADNVTAAYSDDALLRAVLTLNGSPLTGKSVSFSLGGSTLGNATTDASGVALFSHRLQSVAGGTYTAAFAGDTSAGAASATATLTAVKETVVLTYGGTTVTSTGKLTLLAYVAQEADGSAGSAAVPTALSYTVRSGSVTHLNKIAGTAGVQMSTATWGNKPFEVEVLLGASDYYAADPLIVKVKGTAALQAASAVGQYGQSATLTATLTAPQSSGSPTLLANKVVGFTVNGTSAGTVSTNASGVASLAYPVTLGTNVYALAASFAGDTEYAAAAATTTLTVFADPDTTLAYTGATVTAGGPIGLSAAVTGAGGLRVAGAGQIQFVLAAPDGTPAATVTATVGSDGSASGLTASLPNQPYLVTVSLIDGYYRAPAVTAKVKATAALTADTASGQYGDPVSLIARLAPAAAGKAITYKVNGAAAVAASTDGAGVAAASYTVPLGAGTYQIEAAFAGDSDYTAAAGTATLSVSAEAGALAYTGALSHGGGPLTLRATLTEESDTSPGSLASAGSIRFVLRTAEGTQVESLTAAVMSDGSATVTTGALENRPYDVEISLSDSRFYSAPSITRRIRAATALAPSAASAQYSDTVILQATLTPAVSGMQVGFAVNGTAIGTAVTTGSGLATLPYTVTLGAGAFDLVTAFIDNEGYTSAVNTATLTVTAETATLAYTGATVTAGGSISLSALLTEESDGAAGDLSRAGSARFVVRDLDGNEADSLTAPVQSDGSASAVSGLLANQPYQVEVSLLSADYYTAGSATARVKAQASLTVTPASVQYSDSVTLQAILSPAVSGRVLSFAVGGTEAGTAATVASGTAEVSYSAPMQAGTYEITVAFAGNGEYTDAAATGLLTVTPESATLAYTGPAVTTGGALTLSASLVEMPDGTAGSIANAGQVRFVVRNLAGDQVADVTGQVQANGTASATTPALGNLPLSVEVSLANSEYFTATVASGSIKATSTVAVDPASGQYSDSVTLRAVMSPAVSGRSISFTVGGTAVGTAVTGADGAASISYAVASGSGTFTIGASFAGDSNYTNATGSGALTVIMEDASLAYTGPTVTTGAAMTLSASLAETADGSPGTIANAGAIRFVIKSTGGTVLFDEAAPVGSGGTASTTLPPPGNQPLTVEVSLPSNAYYTATGLSAHVRATAALAATAPAVQYSDATTLSASFTPQAAGKQVEFAVGGVTAGSATTDASGVAAMPHTVLLGAGSYAVTATFAGDADYTSAAAGATLAVAAENATLAYTGATLTAGGSLSLGATVSETADGAAGTIGNAGTVQFVIRTLDGTEADTQTAAVQPGGTASATSAMLPSQPYRVTVSLVPNSYYSATAVTAGVKATAALSADSLSGQYSDLVSLRATLTPAAAGKTVTFRVGSGSPLSVVTAADGSAQTSYKLLESAGSYTIDATFAGDADYTAAAASATLTVSQESAALSYNGTTVTADGSLTLSATLEEAADGSLGSIDNAGQVQFVVRTLSGTAVATETVTVGQSATTAALGNQPYDVEVSLLANSYYSASPVTAHVKATSATSASNLTGQFNGSVQLRAVLSPAVSGKEVSFTVDGVAAGTAATDGNGVATATYTIVLAQGTYGIGAAFAGDADYTAAAASATLTVNTDSANLTYTGATVTTGGTLSLGARVTDSGGAPIAGAGTVTFTIRQTNGTVADTRTAVAGPDGTAAATSAVLANEPHDVEIALDGGGLYSASTVSAHIKATASLAVTSPSGQHSDSVVLKATMSPALAGKTVSFAVGGVSAGTAATDASGVATRTYSIGLGAGSYSLAAAFAGDADYTSANAAGTLTVSRETATLTYTGVTVTSGGALGLSAIVAEEADAATGSITSAGTVQFAVRKPGGAAVATLTAAVGADGSASATTAVLPNEPYDVEVSLLSNLHYTATPVVQRIEATTGIVLADAAVQYSDTVTLTAQLTPALASKVVTFTIGGTAVGTAATDANGSAALPHSVQLPAGSYTAGAEFTADGQYTAASDHATLTVTAETATLTFTGSTLSTGGALTLSATLAQESDGAAGDLARAGTVRFVVRRTADGTAADTRTAAVGAGGLASTSSAVLTNAPYDIEVSLDPNGYFTATGTTVHVKAASALTVANTGADYSDVATLQATLSPAASGKTISFTVGGVAAGTANTDASGVASLGYTVALPAGTYTMTATFAGDSDYTSANGSGTLTVSAESATIGYTGTLVSAGGALTLSASVTQSADGSAGDITKAGTVQFVVRDLLGNVVDTQTAAVGSGGSASTTSVSLPKAAYDVTASLLSGNYYSSAPVSVRVTESAALSVSNAAGQYSDQVLLQATLAPALAGREIGFTVNGAAAGTATTDATGAATLTYTIGLGAGTYAVGAAFAGSSEYDAAAGSASLTVSKETATLAFTGDTVTTDGNLTLRAQLTQAADSSPGDPASAGTVEFVVKTLSGTVLETRTAAVGADGVAQTATSGALGNRPYTIDISLMTNSYYAASAISAKVKATTTLGVTAASGQYSDAVTLQASLSPAVAGKSVAFTVNGVSAGTALTTSGGTASLSYSIGLAAGTYEVAASFAGDSDYTAAAATGTLTVTAETATLAYTGDTTTTGGTIMLAAALTQQSDGSAGSLSGSVQFVVRMADGEILGTQTASLTSGGLASASVTNAVNEPHTVEVSLVSSDYYNASPVTAKVKGTAVLTAGSASGQYSDTVTLTATLAPARSGQSVTFQVNGVQAGTAATDGSGSASLPYAIGLGAGTHTITVSLGGDADWTSASASADLVVALEDAALQYTGQTSFSGGTISLAAVVTPASDGAAGDITRAGSVRFRVLQNGFAWSIKTATINPDGTATATSSSLDNGAYTVEVSLVSNSYYTAPVITAPVTSVTSLTVSPPTDKDHVDYSDSGTIEAVLSPALSGRVIEFTLGSTVIGTAATDGSGRAQLTYTVTQGAGQYMLGASFAGDSQYTASSATNTLTVDQEDATLTYSGSTQSGGSSFRLQAILGQIDSMSGDPTRAGTVRFTLTRVLDGMVHDTYDATVGSDGKATYDVPGGLPGYAFTVRTELLSNSYFRVGAGADVDSVAGVRTLTLSSNTYSGQYSDTIGLTATLREVDLAVPNVTVEFSVDGTVVGTPMTNASGVATLSSYTITQRASDLDAGIFSSILAKAIPTTVGAPSASAILLVDKENATLTYTGATTINASGELVLSATLREEIDGSPGDIRRAGALQFEVWQGGSLLSTPGAVPIENDGSASTTLSSWPVGQTYTIKVKLVPDSTDPTYTAPEITAN